MLHAAALSHGGGRPLSWIAGEPVAIYDPGLRHDPPVRTAPARILKSSSPPGPAPRRICWKNWNSRRRATPPCPSDHRLSWRGKGLPQQRRGCLTSGGGSRLCRGGHRSQVLALLHQLVPTSRLPSYPRGAHHVKNKEGWLTPSSFLIHPRGGYRQKFFDIALNRLKEHLNGNIPAFGLLHR